MKNLIIWRVAQDLGFGGGPDLEGYRFGGGPGLEGSRFGGGPNLEGGSNFGGVGPDLEGVKLFEARKKCYF